MTVHESEKVSQNAFQRHLETMDPSHSSHPYSFAHELESQVRYWSDYNRIYHHPRSMMEISQYMHGNDYFQFSTFSQGIQVFSDKDTSNEFMDEHVRFFMEECDSPQGFQILTDVHDGFSGLSSSVLDALKEEYPKKSIVCTGLSSMRYRENGFMSQINESFAAHAFIDSCSLYVPLYIPESNKFISKFLKKVIEFVEYFLNEF